MDISFLTPYLSGDAMMTLHLQSIREYYPNAPILVSKKGGGERDMEWFKDEFGIDYWMDEDAEGYVASMDRLYKRTKTDLICISDHDVILLNNIDYLINGVGKEWDLVGIEEKIHHPWADTWQRYAPGFMDMTFMIFNLKEFIDKWGYEGIQVSMNKEDFGNHSVHEYHYGICEKLTRHKYLLPYHTEKYGMGNLLKDGDKNIAWHQWYGSYRVRPVDNPRYDRVALYGGAEYLERAEKNFLNDYPDLELNTRPAYDDR